MAGAVIVVTQGWLLLSGNFSWRNALTIVLAASSFGERQLSAVIRLAGPWRAGAQALARARAQVLTRAAARVAARGSIG